MSEDTSFTFNSNEEEIIEINLDNLHDYQKKALLSAVMSLALGILVLFNLTLITGFFKGFMRAPVNKVADYVADYLNTLVPYLVIILVFVFLYVIYLILVNGENIKQFNSFFQWLTIAISLVIAFFFITVSTNEPVILELLIFVFMILLIIWISFIPISVLDFYGNKTNQQEVIIKNEPEIELKSEI